MNIAKFLRTPILKNIYEWTASVNFRSGIFQKSLVLPFKLNAFASRISGQHTHSVLTVAILENSIYYVGFLVPEAVAEICFVKKVFLEISQNSR